MFFISNIYCIVYAALSCYDPHSYGLQMGIPIGVIKKDGSKLPLTHIIQNSLKDGEEVSIQFRDAVDRFQSRSTRLSKK